MIQQVRTKLPLQSSSPGRESSMNQSSREGKRTEHVSTIPDAHMSTPAQLGSQFSAMWLTPATTAGDAATRKPPLPVLRCRKTGWNMTKQEEKAALRLRWYKEIWPYKKKKQKCLWPIQQGKLQVWKLTIKCLSLKNLVSISDSGPHTYVPSQIPALLTNPRKEPVWGDMCSP